MSTATKKSVYETLSAIKINPKHIEKKNGLSYLSWAYAWAYVKENYPEATFTIYENKDGLIYHTDGKTAWVKTGVTIEGSEMIEYLPVMDFRNTAIKLDYITSTDVNKTIQRSLTKACARHGLGLNIYAGEDLPMSEATAEQPAVKPAAKTEAKPSGTVAAKPEAQPQPEQPNGAAAQALSDELPKEYSPKLYAILEKKLQQAVAINQVSELYKAHIKLFSYKPWHDMLVSKKAELKKN